MSPACTPTDIDSEKRPADVGTAAAARSEARISTAASQACSGWPSPRKRNSSASPPNLSSSPPRVAAMVSIGPKTRLSASTISSAPIRPCRESRSVRAVKPDTSAKTSVPSTVRCSAPGASSSQTSVRGGTWRRRSVIGRAPFGQISARGALGIARLPHAQGVEPTDPPKAGAQGGLVRVDFLGVRGSVCAPGRDFVRYGGNTSCVAVSVDRDTPPALVLDAGTGIRGVTAMLGGAPFRGTILVSHVHWDHVQGLPFFAAGDRAGASVRLVVPAQGGKSGRDLVAQTMSPPAFPITPEGLIGAWTFDAVHPGELEVEGFSVRAFEVAHKGGRTFGYTVRAGSSSIGYVPDHAPELGVSDDALAALAGVDVPRPRRPVPRARAPSGRRLRPRHRRRRDPAGRAGGRRRGRALPPRAAPHRRRTRRDRPAVHGVDPDRDRGRGPGPGPGLTAPGVDGARERANGPVECAPCGSSRSRICTTACRTTTGS